jgi:hypothetical protein
MQARFKFNSESETYNEEIAYYKTELYRLLDPGYDAKRSYYVDPRAEPKEFTSVWNTLFNLSSRIVDLDPGLLEPHELSEFKEGHLTGLEENSLVFQQKCDACLIVFPDSVEPRAIQFLDALKVLHTLLTSRLVEIVCAGAEYTAAVLNIDMKSMFASNGLFSGSIAPNTMETHIHNSTLETHLHNPTV